MSTGQEVWSLAMRLSEEVGSPLSRAEIEIIGTDVSGPCVETAKAGRYGHFDVQKGLSIHRLMTNFDRLESGDWQVKDGLGDKLYFRRHNLMESAHELGQFDIIICRNVLSGMARPMQRQVADRIAAQLLPGAFFFAAPGETIFGVSETLVPSRDVRGAYIRDTSAKTTEAA